MKIMLLNPPSKFKISRESRWPEFTKSGTLYYPFWLAYATSVLMESKHKSFLLDAIAKDYNFSETLTEIKRFDPDLLVIETTTPTFYNDIEFIKEIREICYAKIILVGAHVIALPDRSLRESGADFVVKGEFDYAILDLANGLEKGTVKNVLGICYRRGKETIHTKPRPLIKDLDGVPFVSKAYKEFLNIRDYRYALARYPMIQIWTSRGCPARCIFCVYSQVYTKHVFRSRSAENVVDEIEWIKENLPQIKEIFFEDDTFSIDQKRTIEICDEILKRKLNIIWSCNVRADLDYETLRKMKSAGCRILIVGYESGSQEILNNIKKGITLEQAEKFTKDAKSVGLKTFGCFMIGLPGETKKTIEETFRFAKKLNCDMVFFQQAVPFPGTEFYAWAKAKGYLITEDYRKWLDKSKQFLYTLARNLHPYEIQRILKAGIDYLSYLMRKE